MCPPISDTFQWPPGLTIEKFLNHAERDVTAVYDRHSYDPEKRTALEAWAAAWRRS